MHRIVLAVALALTLVARAHAAPSLIANGGFESTRSWSFGPDCRLDSTVKHSGARSAMVHTSIGVQMEQLVQDVAPGTTLTASGWIKTDAMRPGANGGFAYLAVYQYSDGGKLVDFRDFLQRSGTTDWTRGVFTFKVHPECDLISFRAGVHNAQGTAWFDDLNLVAGGRPVEWSERSSSAARGGGYRAVILDPATMPSAGAATPARTVVAACDEAGIPCKVFSAAQLIRPGALTDADLLVVPSGPIFPVEARRGLVSFLMRGGDLLTTGGYAFDRMVTRSGDRWQDYAGELKAQMKKASDPRLHLVPDGGFQSGLAGWDVENAAVSLAVADSSAPGGHCAAMTSPDVLGGVRMRHAIPAEAGRSYLVGAMVRNSGIKGQGFAFLAVYQYGADGKLVAFQDFYQGRQDCDWQRREVRVVINPAAVVTRFEWGLYLAKGESRVTQVTCAPIPREERINAHYGDPLDSLTVGPTQLTLFSPDQPIAGKALRPAGLLSARGLRGTLAGAVSGMEATAQMRQNARWQPLLECLDGQGRMAGAAGSLVSHVSGPFVGSRWALYGVTSRDIFAGPAGLKLMSETLRILREPVCADRLATDLALYQPGEKATITLDVACRGGETAIRAAEVTVAAPGGATLRTFRSICKPHPGGTARLSFDLPITRALPDFCSVRATLLGVDGRPVDAVETGFCVASPRVVAGGTWTRLRDNAYELTGPGRRKPERTVLFGTDTYGNMMWSPSCNPLTWFADMRMMRDHGLHMYENLGLTTPNHQYSRAQWRQMDAIIQLSQRFGLPYMAGIMVGQEVCIQDDVLAQEAALCGEFARRYARVPGLIYYLNGDFQLNMKDSPDVRRHWNEFLRTRYATDAALAAAWKLPAGEAVIGNLPVADPPDRGLLDLRARDMGDFRAWLVKRWVTTLVDAIRVHDRVHPITSEYYQKPYNGIDLRTSMDAMDASNFGYFGPPKVDMAQLLSTIRFNDMRFVGKTVNMGEFGVKIHDAWAPERGAQGYQIGRSEKEQRRLFWSVVHAAMACGVSKIMNWCWSDDPDNVFPWGLAWNNPLRPRPVLKLYRNLRAISDRVPIEYRPAKVVLMMPDRWRTVSPDRANAMVAGAIEMLLATNVAFDVANLDWLPQVAERKPQVVLAPFAYNLNDADLAGLCRLAEGGATVYLSGDITTTPTGSRDPGRAALLGTSVSGAPIAAGAFATSLLSGGEVVPVPGATASLQRFPVGQGQFLVSTTPWEGMLDKDLFQEDTGLAMSPARNLYHGITSVAGCRPAATARANGLGRRLLVTPTGANALVSLFTTDPARADRPITVSAAGVALTFGVEGIWPVCALLDRSRAVTAATSCGVLKLGGKQIANGTGPWMLVSRAGMPIPASRSLLLTLTDGGSLEWKSTVAGMKAWIVEMQGGLQVKVGPARLARIDGGYRVMADPNELVLVEAGAK